MLFFFQVTYCVRIGGEALTTLIAEDPSGNSIYAMLRQMIGEKIRLKVFMAPKSHSSQKHKPTS